MLRTISIIALIVAALITAYFFMMFSSIEMETSGESVTTSIDMPADDTAFGGIFYSPYIDDSLPYYKYRTIKDSVERKQQEIKMKNQSFGSGMSMGSIGVFAINKENNFWRKASTTDAIAKSLEDSLSLLQQAKATTKDKDSVDNIDELSDEVLRRLNKRNNDVINELQQKQEKLYYFALVGYQPKDYNTKFFIDGDSYNLAYMVVDSVGKNTYQVSQAAHYERKQIPVRYSAEEKKILIPVTKSQYNYIYAGLNVWFYLSAFLSMYFFLGLPIQILINISKGKAFTLKNIRRFRLIAIVLFVYGLLNVLMPHVLALVFRNYIPNELVRTPFIQTIFGDLPVFFIALGVFLVSKAFERGYRLQQENALTI